MHTEYVLLNIKSYLFFFLPRLHLFACECLRGYQEKRVNLSLGKEIKATNVKQD